MTSLHDSQRQRRRWRRRGRLTSAFFVSDFETRVEFAFLLLQLPLTRAAHSAPPPHTMTAWSDCVCCRCFHVHYEALVFRLVFCSSSLSWAALSTWLCLECSQSVETQQCKHLPVPLPHPHPTSTWRPEPVGLKIFQRADGIMTSGVHSRKVQYFYSILSRAAVFSALQ